jgi:hydroxymethylglutaryl-CoA reductase
MQFLTFGIAAVLLSALVSAHPGHNPAQEATIRSNILGDSKRDISHCSAELKARGTMRQTIDRRLEILKSERQKRGLPTGEQHKSEPTYLANVLLIQFFSQLQDTMGESMLVTYPQHSIQVIFQTSLTTRTMLSVRYLVATNHAF